MSVQRTQYAVASVSTTVVSHTSSAIDLPRPADVAETNTIDHVARPAARKEYESGRCVIYAAEGTTFYDAGLVLEKLEIVALNPGVSLAPMDLSFSQFPAPPGVGMPTAVLKTIVDLSGITQATNPYTMQAQITVDLLKTILLRADEFVRVTLYNTTG